MKFWIPVVSKWQSKQYKTLADVPEGVACVVSLTGELYLRVRKGDRAYSLSSNGALCAQSNAGAYPFVRTLDPLPEPKVSIADLPDGRCFTAGQLPNSVYWKHSGSTYYVLGDGRFGCSSPFNHIIYPDAILDIEMQLQDFPVTQSN